jgi:hypothetical protein
MRTKYDNGLVTTETNVARRSLSSLHILTYGCDGTPFEALRCYIIVFVFTPAIDIYKTSQLTFALQKC